jgi:signal transduction histidine kinase
MLAATGLAAAVAWFVDHPAGAGWSALVAKLTLAATAPLSMLPLVMSVSAGMTARVGLTLASLAVLPFALYLASWVAQTGTARAARYVAVTCVALACVAGAAVGWDRSDGYLISQTHYMDQWALRLLLVAAAVLVPGVTAALSVLRDPSVPLTRHARIVTSTVLAIASVLPVMTSVALVSPAAWPALIVAVAAAFGTVAFLGWLAIGPLARDAGTMTTQRDLVIAASESERVRLAASLHDGPLGDVALLVQRLDAVGDAENAALARGIADELRDVGNDLRLPLVEDLGVGAGLEWLVDRLSRTSGTTIDLAVTENGRPPVEIESAVYRIAQEALMNATRHGSPPIEVTYVAESDSARSIVTDAGPGIDPDAQDRALREGRLGLMLMRRRAEAIGASIEIKTRPEGGAVVDIRWQRGQD